MTTLAVARRGLGIGLPLTAAVVAFKALSGLSTVIAVLVALPLCHGAALAALSAAAGRFGMAAGARRLALWSVTLSLPLYLVLLVEGGLSALNQLSYRLQWSERDFAMARLVASIPGGPREAVPAAHGIQMYKPFRSELYSVNSLGLRTIEPTPKRPGEWRVGVAGGSTVWGYGVVDQDSVPGRLAAILAPQAPMVTVVNLGLENLTFDRELRILKAYAEAFQLDQVIFYHGVNDTAGSYNVVFRPKLANKDDFLVARGGGVLGALRRTNIHARLDLWAARLLPPRIPPMPEPRLSEAIAAAAGDYAATLARARAFCGARGLVCEFFWQPEVTDKPVRTYFERQYVDDRDAKFPGFAGFARRYGDAVLAAAPGVVDLRGVFTDAPQAAFTDVVHLNGEANGLVARALAGRMARPWRP